MTIFDSLKTENTYPIPDNTIEKFCIVRGLVISEEFTKEVGVSEPYELVTADLLVWLSESPDLKEQEASIKHMADVKQDMLDRANKIYNKYGDPKFSGGTYGFQGEDYD